VTLPVPLQGPPPAPNLPQGLRVPIGAARYIATEPGSCILWRPLALDESEQFAIVLHRPYPQQR
jgi:hypothetical protein